VISPSILTISVSRARMSASKPKYSMVSRARLLKPAM